MKPAISDTAVNIFLACCLIIAVVIMFVQYLDAKSYAKNASEYMRGFYDGENSAKTDYKRQGYFSIDGHRFYCLPVSHE